MTSDEKFDKVLHGIMELIHRGIIRDGEDIDKYIHNRDRSSIVSNGTYVDFNTRNVVIHLKDEETDWNRIFRINEDVFYHGYNPRGYDGGTQNGKYVDIYGKSLLPKELFEFEEKI